MYRRQFKEPLNRARYDSSERRVLDLISEVPGSILTGGNILLLELLFSRSKAYDANIINFVMFVTMLLLCASTVPPIGADACIKKLL